MEIVQRKRTKLSYAHLVQRAVESLTDSTKTPDAKKAASYQAICKYISSKWAVPATFTKNVSRALKQLVSEKQLSPLRRSYKLAGAIKKNVERKVAKKEDNKRKRANVVAKKRAALPAPKAVGVAAMDVAVEVPKPKADVPKPAPMDLEKAPQRVYAENEVRTTRIQGKSTNIELVFSFDTTGSMNKVLQEVRDKISQMVRRLFADIPGIRIAVIAHGDYCDKLNYVVKMLDFSTDEKSICDFVNTAKATDGGDWEEAYEYMMHEAKKLSWTQNYSKALVVIGDAIPHSVQKSEMHLDWRKELADLNKMEIKVYGVQAYPADNATAFYKEIAEVTGGEHIPLSEMHHIGDVFMELCYMEAAERNMDDRHEMHELVPEGEMHLFVPNEIQHLELSEKELLSIHHSIHSNENTVIIRGKSFPVTTGKSKCRMVRIEDITFVEQSKSKRSKFSRMAEKGQKITWFIQNGHWGSIVDDVIDKKAKQRRESDMLEL